MKEVLNKIKSRGYWEVTIHPSEFLENRINNLAKCKEIIRELSVQLRGWDYPHFDSNNWPKSNIDFVEQSLDWQDKIEYWRYYQSGQFVHFFGMWEDWQEQSTIMGPKLSSEPGKVLSVFNALYHFSEIYEFASRLAVKGYLGSTCKLHITLHGIKGRSLRILDPSRLLFANYRSEIESIPKDIAIETDTLISKSANLALEHCVWVFQRFNWDNVPIGVLKDEQRKLLERRL